MERATYPLSNWPMDAQTAIDIAIGVCTLIGIVGSGIGAFWLAFRKKLKRWWRPYRAGIDGMSELPMMREAVEQSRKDMHLLRKEVALVGLQIKARADINIANAEFECDAMGALTYASRTYARWLGVGKQDLLGWGWVNYIHPDDRLKVRQEWDLCRAEHRVYSQRCRMIDADGEDFTVETIVTPIPDLSPAKQWIGVIRRVVD